MAGRAALGLIGPDLVGIAIEPNAGGIVLHIAALRSTAELADDIAEMVSIIEAYLAGGPEQDSTITTNLHIGQPDLSWAGRQHDLLFVAKP